MWAAHSLAQAVGVRPDEIIVEIGPGKGALTKELLATGANVIAIEKDGALAEGLAQTFAEEIASGTLRVITGDIRDVVIGHEPDKTASDAVLRTLKDCDLQPIASLLGKSGVRNKADGIVLAGGYVVAANIPYYITGEIIRQFLETDTQPRAMALLVQKEVADRIVARDGKESILSLSVKAYGVPKIVAKVSRGNFSPPPRVDSAILLVADISKKSFSGFEEKAFFKVVKAGFASKRKFLANNIGVVFGKGEAIQALEACGLSAKVRAEDVPLLDWEKLTQELS